MSPLTKPSSPNDVLSATFCQAIGRGVKLHSELPKAALLQGAIRQQSKTSQPSHSAFISYVVNLNHARSDSSPDHAELSLTRLIHFFVCLGGFCLFVCFWGFLIYPPAPTQAHWSDGSNLPKNQCVPEALSWFPLWWWKPATSPSISVSKELPHASLLRFKLSLNEDPEFKIKRSAPG